MTQKIKSCRRSFAGLVRSRIRRAGRLELEVGIARALGRLEERLHLFSARGGTSLREVRFAPGDVLVFGCESTGLPPALLEAHADRRVRIPIHEGVRSINLANAVAIALFLATGSA